MKNALLALALFAFVGTASANDGTKPGKKAKAGAKKEACAKMAAGTSSCCMKGGATAAAKTPAAAPVAVKSL